MLTTATVVSVIADGADAMWPQWFDAFVRFDTTSVVEPPDASSRAGLGELFRSGPHPHFAER